MDEARGAGAGPGWIAAQWAAPAAVRAGTTTREGGVSTDAWASLNLASHVGDAPEAVRANRARLARALALPAEPLWLRQVHGRAVVVHDGRRAEPQADAAVAFEPRRVLAVLSADCVPVALASQAGDRIGLAHVGWRGLLAGVIEATSAALALPAAELCAWLGPAIGPAAFEVGAEVRAALVAADPEAGSAFAANARGRWQADLAALARLRLARLGVSRIAGGELCTYRAVGQFYSYRRDSRCGRMATLAWIAGDD